MTPHPIPPHVGARGTLSRACETSVDPECKSRRESVASRRPGKPEPRGTSVAWFIGVVPHHGSPPQQGAVLGSTRSSMMRRLGDMQPHPEVWGTSGAMMPAMPRPLTRADIDSLDQTDEFDVRMM